MNQARRTAVLFVLAFSLSFVSPASAQEETLGDYFNSIGRKFVRGVGHVITSPADIPCTISFDMEEAGAPGFFTGFGKGTVLMLRRILVGVTEIGTFMIPAERTIPPVCQSSRL